MPNESDPQPSFSTAPTDLLVYQFNRRGQPDDATRRDGWLRESVRRYGILCPLLIEWSEDDRLYVLDGRRRLRCASRLGLPTVPCVVLPTLPAGESLARRSALHPPSAGTAADFTTRDEANTLVAWAFRNGPLERLHAGRHSPLLDDPSLSRITDPEMKELMLNACRQLADLLALKADDPADYARRIRAYHDRYCRQWER